MKNIQIYKITILITISLILFGLPTLSFANIDEALKVESKHKDSTSKENKVIKINNIEFIKEGDKLISNPDSQKASLKNNQNDETTKNKETIGNIRQSKIIILLTLTLILFALVGAFLMSLSKLGASGPPQSFSDISTCLWTGIASLLIGSATVIIAFFYN